MQRYGRSCDYLCNCLYKKNNYDDSFFYYITNKLLCSRGAADWSNIACARRTAVDDGGFGAGGGELEVVEDTGDRDRAEEQSQFGSNEVADLESWQQMNVLDARQFQAHTRYCFTCVYGMRPYVG